LRQAAAVTALKAFFPAVALPYSSRFYTACGKTALFLACYAVTADAVAVAAATDLL